jgi:hypothetical protein
MAFTVSVDLKLSAELAVDPWRSAAVSLLVMAIWFQCGEVLTAERRTPSRKAVGFHSQVAAGRWTMEPQHIDVG